MEYAKEDILNIRYNEKKDCTETDKKKGFIRRHRFISTALLATIILIGVNVFFIYEFFNMLIQI